MSTFVRCSTMQGYVPTCGIFRSLKLHHRLESLVVEASSPRNVGQTKKHLLTSSDKPFMHQCALLSSRGHLTCLPSSDANNCIYKLRRFHSSSASSEREGIWGKVKGAFTDRMEKRKVDKTREQFDRIGKLDKFTLGAFLNEYNDGLSDWAAKIPGFGNTPEKKRMQETQKLLQTMVNELGKDATNEDLLNLDRKQKLTICLKGETTIDNVNLALGQYKAMDLMHRVIKYRQESGQETKLDDESLKAAMQETGPRVMTGDEKRSMRRTYMKSQEKSMGGLPSKR